MSDPARHEVLMIEPPPKTLGGILRRLGPGLIIAGSIVGSGELIGTTTTGAQAGYYLLWLIIIGCMIKVFVQVEFGRYSISTGQASMVGMNATPGPVLELAGGKGPGAPRVRANWLAWYWLAMFLVSLGQLGGIVGGVGQGLAISVPITEAGRAYNQAAEAKAKLVYQMHLDQYARDQLAKAGGVSTELPLLDEKIAAAKVEIAKFDRLLKGSPGKDGEPPVVGLESSAHDHQIWAVLITIVTSFLLVAGRYGFIQWASTFMVAAFTLMTLINLGMLQSQPEWAVGWSDIVAGLSFQLPSKQVDASGSTFYPLATALATFGIIGVGANELISYPYWCIEKGYARYVGPREAASAWAERAHGWMRVLRWDAWCSMGVYTFATIAFYLLGAATLGRIHLTPKGVDMIRTLSVMYEPVFGGWTQPVFLFGAFAVLYSTFFVATAGHARVTADAVRVFGGGSTAGEVNPRTVKCFSGFYPFVCLAVYLIYPEPTGLVLASGAMQAIMLPMLSFAALYFRYRCVDERLRPGKLWDLFLWASAIGMLVAGGWTALIHLFPALKELA